MKKKNSNTMFNKIVNSKLVNNKITLYIVALIALITLLGYIMVAEFSAIILFFLIGAVAYSFTKNMTIFFVTHRNHNIKYFNKIIRINNGNVFVTSR